MFIHTLYILDGFLIKNFTYYMLLWYVYMYTLLYKCIQTYINIYIYLYIPSNPNVVKIFKRLIRVWGAGSIYDSWCVLWLGKLIQSFVFASTYLFSFTNQISLFFSAKLSNYGHIPCPLFQNEEKQNVHAW